MKKKTSKVTRKTAPLRKVTGHFLVTFKVRMHIMSNKVPQVDALKDIIEDRIYDLPRRSAKLQDPERIRTARVDFESLVEL